MPKKRSKGELSIQAIAAILITIAGIALVILLASQFIGKENFYCKTLYKVKGGLWYGKKDRACEIMLKLEKKYVQGKEGEVSVFSNNAREMSFPGVIGGQRRYFNISVPRRAVVNNAYFFVESHPLKLREFSTASSSGVEQDILNFPRGGGSHVVTFQVPKGAVIKNAKMRLEGLDIPGQADLVFVIDTSESMDDEWESVCTSIELLAANLNETTDMIVNVYALGDNIDQSGDIKITFDQECDDPSIVLKQDLTSSQLNEYFDLCLSTNPAECIFNPPPQYVDQVGPNTPWDTWTEAWGIGVWWVIRNHNFRPNSKHIIIPVSDSDPTGGGTLRNNINLPEGMNVFSGNEGGVIQRIIATSTPMDYIFPVAGNPPRENDPLEGYRVGNPECINPETNNPSDTYNRCRRIMRWMNQLASATGGAVAQYRNTNLLIDAVKAAINTSFPEDLRVSIQGSEVAYFPGELNSSNSPVIVEFWRELQDYLDSCAPDARGLCSVNMTFESGNEGSLKLDKLVVDYYLPVDDFGVSINNTYRSYGPLVAQGKTLINITNEVRNFLNTSCAQEVCTIPVFINASSPNAVLKVSGLRVEYVEYPLEEALLNEILECWDKADRGRKREDFLCSELIVPDSYVFLEPVTEERITSLIRQRQLCRILPNSDFGCGTRDSLEFAKSIKSHTNVLIEYKSRQRQILVS